MAKIEKHNNSEIKIRDDNGKLHTFSKKVLGDGYTDHNGKTIRNKSFGNGFEYKDSKSGVKETFRNNWNNTGYVGNKGSSINGNNIRTGKAQRCSNGVFSSFTGASKNNRNNKLGLGSIVFLIIFGGLALISPFNVGGVYSKLLIVGAIISIIVQFILSKSDKHACEPLCQMCCSLCIIGALYFDLQNTHSFAKWMAIIGIAIYIGIAALISYKLTRNIISLLFCVINYIQFYLIITNNLIISIVLYACLTILILSRIIIFRLRNSPIKNNPNDC